MSAPGPARLFRQVASAAEFAATCHEAHRPDAVAEAAGLAREDLDAACRALGLDAAGTGTGRDAAQPPLSPAGETPSQADALRAAARLVDMVGGRAVLYVEVDPGRPVEVQTNYGYADAESLAGLRVLAGMFGVAPADKYRLAAADGTVCPQVTFEVDGVPFVAFAHIAPGQAPAEVADAARAWIGGTR